MEQLNKIELRGNVGNIRLESVGDQVGAPVSLGRTYAYKGKDGTPVIETTWHNIVAWSGKGMPDFKKILKGSCIYVTGRIRFQKFNGSDGTEKQYYEVLANRLAIIEHDDMPMHLPAM